jgi:endonuclease/exonuclease/phosphatase family metal-dependent hydrolase
MSKGLLPKFMKSFNLHTWKPKDKEIVTFPFLGGSRIDWIFLSSEFEILEQRILEDVVSDHKVVKLTIQMKK